MRAIPDTALEYLLIQGIETANELQDDEHFENLFVLQEINQCVLPVLNCC